MVWISLLAGLFLTSACKSVRVVEPLEPMSETTLIVTRSGDAATLSWTAEKGVKYTVLYSDQLGGRAQWNVLPGAARLQGAAGQVLTVNDRLGVGIKRYYRLHVEKEGK